MISSAFERLCVLYSITALVLGLCLYTRAVPDVVSLLGVGKESAHSNRNTGIFFIFIALLSSSAINAAMRFVPMVLGSLVVPKSADAVQTFASGMTFLVTLVVMIHYTVESFYYGDVSKIAVVGVWILSVLTFLGIRISLVAEMKKA